MRNKRFTIFCSVFFFLISCQKDLKTDSTLLNTGNQLAEESSAQIASNQVVDTTSHWVGSYASSFASNYPTVSDKQMISGGIAKDPQISQQFEFSNISYQIPSKRYIGGDSITFEARVRNTVDMGQSGYDIALQLFGKKHNAEVFFVGLQSGLPYTHYFVGNLRYDGLQPLVHYFGQFETIKLVMKNNSTTVYLGSTELYSFNYGFSNRLGRLQKINVAFKGIGEVTRVAVRNSFGQKLIFSEDFSVNGQSHVIYYN